MKTSEKRKAGGFTLVELLVVILIVAVLAAISLVASRRMIASGKMAKSVDNMRQISALVVSSAADSGGLLMALRDFNGYDDPAQPSNWHWNQQVAWMQYPDTEKKKISESKDWWFQYEPLAKNPQQPTSGFETYFSGYAMNLMISENYYVKSNNGDRNWEMFLRQRVPLAAINTPERTPLIAPHWNWHTGDLLNGEKLANPEKSKPFLSEGKMNIVFVDGHAEMIQFATPDGKPIGVSEYARRGLNRMPTF